MEKKLYAFFDVLFGIIFSLGILGNMLNIIVFSRKNMKKTTTYYILLYLSQIDLFLLIIILSDKIELKLYSEATCKMIMFLTQYLTQLSSVVLTLISIERTIVIYKKDLGFFRLRSIKKLIVLIIVVFAIVNFHYLLFFHLSQGHHVELDKFELKESVELRGMLNQFKAGEKEYKAEAEDLDFKYRGNLTNKTNAKNEIKYISYNLCFPIDSLNYIYFLNHIWIWVHNLFYSFIPILIMLISSALIIIKIKQSSQTRLPATNCIQRQENFRKNQIFYMLISTNIFFIFCTLPFCITSNSHFNASQNFYSISELLAHSNASFNFVFNFIFSTKYQACVYSMMKRLMFFKKPTMTCMKKGSAIEVKELNQKNSKDFIAIFNNPESKQTDLQFKNNKLGNFKSTITYTDRLTTEV